MKKSHLPSKYCLICHLPFNWRKKWALMWAEVKYCSKKCAQHARKENSKKRKSRIE